MIDLLESDTWLTPDQGTTSGSQSIKTNFAGGLRQACAEARQALIEMAAKKLGVPANTLVTRDGAVVSTADSSKRATYGELIGGQRFNLKSTGRAPLKKPSELKVVGRRSRHVDIPHKVRSQARVHPERARCPGCSTAASSGRRGSTRSSSASTASRSGSRTSSRSSSRRTSSASSPERRAGRSAPRRTLKVTWKDPGGVPELRRAVRADGRRWPAQARLLASDGNVDKALAGRARRSLEATYYYPYQLHGSMGPSCAIADVKADEATVWSPTQGVYPLRAAVAKVLGFQDQQVHVIYKEGSGCYGLNGADTASIDAVLMSKAVGAPVRVQWMRADEHVWEHYGDADGDEGQGRPRRRRQPDRLGLREPRRPRAAAARATSARRTCRPAP